MTVFVCVVGENKQRQVQPQVLRLRCSQNAVSNFAQDDKIFRLEEEKAKAGFDWVRVWVEKRISPLRCPQRREQLRSK
jgi:hypothetical protein